MQVYKKEEGMWARMPTAIIGGIITYYVANAVLGWGRGIASYIWSAVVFAVLGVITLYIAFFHKKTGEMLIDTENELRKVVWPTREEVTGSTIVVIITTLLLGVFIFTMDILLTNGLDVIGLY